MKNEETVNRLLPVRCGIIIDWPRKGVCIHRGCFTKINRINMEIKRYSFSESEGVIENKIGRYVLYQDVKFLLDSYNDEQITDQLFESWWNSYGKKSGNKRRSKKCFLRIPKKKITLLMEHTRDYVKSTPNKVFRKLPETYLSQKHYENSIDKELHFFWTKDKFRDNLIDEDRHVKANTDLLKAFFHYWTEEVEGGLMRFQTKENFDMRKRLWSAKLSENDPRFR